MTPLPPTTPPPAGTQTPRGDLVGQFVSIPEEGISPDKWERIGPHGVIALRVELAAALADRDTFQADANIHANRVDVLSRRLDNVNDALSAAMPDYDRLNTPASQAIGRLHEQLNNANSWVAGLSVEKKSLISQLSATRKQLEEARGLLGEITRCCPATDGQGALYHMHFDENGRELGPEYIDPLAVIQHMQGIAHRALAPDAATSPQP